jgi:hypothetical protein
MALQLFRKIAVSIAKKRSFENELPRCMVIRFKTSGMATPRTKDLGLLDRLRSEEKAPDLK